MQINNIRINKKTLIILLLLSMACLVLRLYPHILIPRMFPSGEDTNISYTTYLVGSNGIVADFFHVPQLEFILVYVLSILSKIDIYSIMFSINPILSGLTVISFFFFATKILKSDKQALVASALFVFSETMFYRTCYYGSTEALGILLMFIYLAIYVRRPALSIPFLILIPFAHVLPFIFAGVLTTVDLLIKKKKLILICLVIGSIIFIFNPFFSPHRLITSAFSNISSNISLNKLFLYNITDIISVFPFLMGLVSMLLLCLFSYKKASNLEKGVFVVLLFGLPVGLLLYSTGIISPIRLLLYISIPLFTMTARLLGNGIFFSKKAYVIILIIIMMILSPLIGGTNYFLWTSDSITQKEINAVDILASQGLFIYGNISNWYADLPMKQYLNLYSGELMYNNYQNKPICFHYVFLSERMEKNGFFITTIEGERTIEERKPVIDIWAQNKTGWETYYYKEGLILKGWNLIYTIEGTKIYEADCYLVENPTEKYRWK